MDEENYEHLTYSKEVELQEKIRSLESNMASLLKKLAIERSKLIKVIEDGEPNVNTLVSNQPASKTKFALTTNSVATHLPTCSHSMIIVEIDPNCEVHGHIYKNKSTENNRNVKEQINEESVVSLFRVNSEQIDTASVDNLYADGDKPNSTSDITISSLSNDDQIQFEDEADDDVNGELYNKLFMMNVNPFSMIEPAAENPGDPDYDEELLIQRQNPILENIYNYNANNNLVQNKNEQQSMSKTVFLETVKLASSQSYTATSYNNDNNNFNKLQQNNDVKYNLELKNMQIMKAEDFENYNELSVVLNEIEKQNSAILNKNELESLLNQIKFNYFRCYFQELPADLLKHLL